MPETSEGEREGPKLGVRGAAHCSTQGASCAGIVTCFLENTELGTLL